MAGYARHLIQCRGQVRKVRILRSTGKQLIADQKDASGNGLKAHDTSLNTKGQYTPLGSAERLEDLSQGDVLLRKSPGVMGGEAHLQAVVAVRPVRVMA